jgi:2Fe-2S ferredoxin
MVSVKFILENGVEQVADIGVDVSVMEGALKAGVEGIDADCGGALSCATCHVRIPAPWGDMVPPASAAEKEMLEFAVDPDDMSRLSCQVILQPALEGMHVLVPAAQR